MTTATDSERVLASLYGNKDENGAFTGPIVNERAMRVKYWKKPDGRIGIGPDILTDAPKYQQYTQNKRWKELPDRFGKEVLNKGLMTPLRVERGKETRWLEPFILGGGLTYLIQPNDPFGTPQTTGQFLMPPEQLVELNMHRDPEIRALRPDLAGAVDLECPYACVDQQTGKHRLFSGMTAPDAQRSVDSHVVAVHRDAVASRAVGQTISDAMKSVLGKQGNVDAEMVGAIVAAVMAAMNPQQTAAVAATNLPAPVEVPPAIPGVPNPELVPGHNGFPDETWRRQDIMKWAGEQDMPMPEAPFKLKTTQWLEWVRLYAPPDYNHGGVQNT